MAIWTLAVFLAMQERVLLSSHGVPCTKYISLHAKSRARNVPGGAKPRRAALRSPVARGVRARASARRPGAEGPGQAGVTSACPRCAGRTVLFAGTRRPDVELPQRHAPRRKRAESCAWRRHGASASNGRPGRCRRAARQTHRVSARSERRCGRLVVRHVSARNAQVKRAAPRARPRPHEAAKSLNGPAGSCAPGARILTRGARAARSADTASRGARGTAARTRRDSSGRRTNLLSPAGGPSRGDS